MQDDLRLFDEVQPDLIVGDFRLSLCISARVAKIPFASVFNAHWSPLRRQPAIAPATPLSRYLPPRLLNGLFAAFRPAVFALHAKPVNDIRREFGLAPLSRDLGTLYTTGDLTLYPDLPEFAPIAALPANHHYIGTCPFALPTPTPPWWDSVMNSAKPKVFVSLGSSGPLRAMPAILQALADLPVQVLVATSGRDPGPLGANVFAADLLPYEATAARCAFVVSHGGTGGLYPTLAAGVPLLAIPANLDNHLSADLLQRSGAGLVVRLEHATASTLRRAMQRLLREPSFTAAARQFSAHNAQHDTRTLFPRIVKDWFTALAPASSGAPVPEMAATVPA